MMMCDTMIYHAMHYDGGDDDDGVAGSRMVRVMTMMMRLCVFIVMVIIAATITIFVAFSSFGKFLQQPVCCMKSLGCCSLAIELQPRLLQPRLLQCSAVIPEVCPTTAHRDCWPTYSSGSP